MGIAIKAEDVSIRYITGDFKDIGFKEYLVRRLTGNYHVKEFMAVDGVSFELEQGDMLGIIGSNGAGKSTLLKAISGIMEPTQGRIVATGEIAALLELGSGFDGDLTVKENAYLRGAMLGYTKEFMDQTYDQIIDFAELRDFEDRPFKQLSSGMKSRLAFSIASLVKPDILILDEVLSVGDGAFQEKSAKKMREIISQGTTTILVSHSLSQIRELCNKVLWLDHGRQIAFGDTEVVCDQYENFSFGEKLITQQVKDRNSSVVERPSTNSISKRTPAAWICTAITAFFAASVVYAAATGVFQFFHRTTEVVISPVIGTGPVTFRGAQVDGVWCSPSDMVSCAEQWDWEPSANTYTAIGKEPLILELPAGTERFLIFTVGPDEGNAKIEMDGQIIPLSFKNETYVELGWSYSVPSITIQTLPKNILIILFLIFVVGLIFFPKRKAVRKRNDRELAGDLLRGISCFTVVLLHCTCNRLEDLSFPNFALNSLTAFAVPCFYMLSGAYLLQKSQSIKVTIQKRVPKLLLPLLFWSLIYICVSGNITPERFIDMFFQEQATHLWYLYCLLGLYMLLPLLSTLWQSLNQHKKCYLLLLFLIIPTILHDVEYLCNYFVKMPYFALFWPDMGLFFLGAFLMEQKELLRPFNKCLPIIFVIGWGWTYLGTKYLSIKDGMMNKSFFALGSCGVVLMTSALFLYAFNHEAELQKLPVILKKLIAALGIVSFEIYLIHPLVITLCENLLNNNKSLIQMSLGAMMYFVFSAIVCISGKRIYNTENVKVK